MDKLKPILAQKFWILSAVCLLLPLTGWWLATGAMALEYTTRTKAIDDAFKGIPQPGPNQKWTDRVLALNTEEEQKVKQPKKDIGPHVYLYSDRCIMCTRCVRFTREVTGTAELSVVMGSLVGGGLGFLWFNAPPAKVFMGDTGSLALGGCLGAMAVCVKHEIVLAIVGGLFLLEALSVIIQVVYFKATGKRFFKMAPIHHHFEKLGWTEPQVVIRFWIISVVLALVGLSTLKLR